MFFIQSMNPASPLPFLPVSAAGSPRRHMPPTPAAAPLSKAAELPDEDQALIERLLAHGSL